MRDKYQIEIGGGQDHLSGNIFRIGQKYKWYQIKKCLILQLIE